MRLKSHGPLGIVTGSCYELIEPESKLHFLVDCGMQQGEPTEQDWNHGPFPFDPRDLDFVLLTHAHLDHCGLIPRLYAEGFEGVVYTTAPTRDLAIINLTDSVKHDTGFLKEHVDAIKWKVPRGQVLNREHRFRGLRITFRRTAHILGAVSIRVSWGQEDEHNQIVFSGDIGNNGEGDEFQPLLRHRVGPFQPRGERSYVVMESTYGGRNRSLHEKSFDVRVSELERHIRETCLQEGGILMLPCFAIGRTQDVLFDLHYLLAAHPDLSKIPIIFDACMARKVNDVYARHLLTREDNGSGQEPRWMSSDLLGKMGMNSGEERLLAQMIAAMLRKAPAPLEAKNHVSSLVQRFAANWEPGTRREGRVVMPTGPAIVVTGGGMCDGGLALQYFPQLLRDAANMVLFTGYCGPQTNGGKLTQLNELSEEERQSDDVVNLKSVMFRRSEIEAKIARISGYSGHADEAGLVDWFFGRHAGSNYPAGSTAFLTHGTDSSRRKLARALRDRARELDTGEVWSARDLTFESPTSKDGWYDLQNGGWIPDEQALLDSIKRPFEGLTTEQKEKVLNTLMDTLAFV